MDDSHARQNGLNDAKLQQQRVTTEALTFLPAWWQDCSVCRGPIVLWDCIIYTVVAKKKFYDLWRRHMQDCYMRTDQLWHTSIISYYCFLMLPWADFTETTVQLPNRTGDMSGVVTCLLWWHVCSSDMSAVVTCLQWWHVCSGDMSAVVTCLQWWHVCRGVISMLVTCLVWWHVCSGDISTVVTCLLWWHVCSGDMSAVVTCL